MAVAVLPAWLSSPLSAAFSGSPSQGHRRVSHADGHAVVKVRSKFLTFLSLHSKPEPRPSQKEWSGSGCCVAIFYCKISNEP